MLARNIASGVLLHMILKYCGLSTRSFLIEMMRIVCFLTLTKLRRNSHVKITILPIMRQMLKLCMPKEHGMCVELSSNMITFRSSSNLYVTCNSPLLLASGVGPPGLPGSGYITTQMKLTHVRMNGINLPEAIWVRIFSYYMPKRVTVGRLVLDVTVSRVSKRTMKFKFCGDVSKWTGDEPMSAYMRFTSSTVVELFSIPDIFRVQ